VPVGGREQRGEHLVVGRATVVVGAPDPVRPERQGVQHAEGEAPGAAQVAPARQVGGREATGLHRLPHGVVGPVVHDDHVVGAPALRADRGQALAQQLGAVAGDDHRDDGLAGAHARPL
jgi:hypothetical protein